MKEQLIKRNSNNKDKLKEFDDDFGETVNSSAEMFKNEKGKNEIRST